MFCYLLNGMMANTEYPIFGKYWWAKYPHSPIVMYILVTIANDTFNKPHDRPTKSSGWINSSSIFNVYNMYNVLKYKYGVIKNENNFIELNRKRKYNQHNLPSVWYFIWYFTVAYRTFLQEDNLRKKRFYKHLSKIYLIKCLLVPSLIKYINLILQILGCSFLL